MTTRHVKPARFPRIASARDLVLALIAVVLTPVVEWFDDAVAEPVAAWWKDLKKSEQVYAAIKTSVLIGCLVGVVISLAGCDDDQPTIPGHGTEPSAVKIADGLDLDTCEMARVLDVDPVALAATLRTAS